MAKSAIFYRHQKQGVVHNYLTLSSLVLSGAPEIVQWFAQGPDTVRGSPPTVDDLT